MIRLLRALCSPRESGQAMIMFAVLSSAILGIAGLAIEGGRLMVEHRRMQVAADMAALVGAQEAGCSASDTACINNAKQTACEYARQNGFGGGWSAAGTCLSAGGSTVTVDIPPATCSPYSLDYGNGKTAVNHCLSTSSSGHYDYVEVEISQYLGVVPIFQTPVTEYVHAVARKGTHSPRDFAIAVLDQNLSPALSLGGNAGGGTSGNALYVVGSIMSNSSASNSISHGGSRYDYSCGGEWFTASGSEIAPPDSYLKSYEIGSAFFAPAGCTGTIDSSTAWNPGTAPIADPYGGAGTPPSGGWTACVPCGQLGHYYHWTTLRSSGVWDDKGAGTPANVGNGDRYEFFPGKYPNGITINSGNIYFNPGVYTLGTSGGLKVTGGNVCVFGAPICDRFSSSSTSGTTIPGTAQYCGTAGMQTTNGTYTDPNVDPATWYYYCSSWGAWDTYITCTPKAPYPAPPSGLCTSPRFTVGNAATSTPLNGVTFYGAGGGSGFNISGNGVMSLAFPDPCPGTGTFAAGTSKVPFQAVMGSGGSGSTSAQYTYPVGSLPYTDWGATSALNAPTSGTGAGNLYPSADLTVDGEASCRAALNGGDTSGSIPDVWPGEFQPLTGSGSSGQLLHFVAFMRDNAAAIQLAGGGTQLWWGIVYNPGQGTNPGCGGSTSGCQISLTGGSGAAGGPPMLIGQVVGDGVNLGGSATLEVFYRPCDPRQSNCQLGPGSSLVQ